MKSGHTLERSVFRGKDPGIIQRITPGRRETMKPTLRWEMTSEKGKLYNAMQRE